MGVDVDDLVFQVLDARFLQRQLEGADGTLRFRVRSGDVVGVAGVAVAHNLGVDLGPSGLGVLILLQDQDARAFAHDKAAAALVEWGAGLFRVLAGGQRLAVGKACNANRVDCGLCSARDDGVGIAVAHRAECLTDGICGGCAGGYNRQIWSLCVVTDGDVAARDVADHHWDQKRRDMARTALKELEALVGDGVDAAASAADIDAKALRLDVLAGFEPGILHCLGGSRHRVLGKQVHLSDLGFFNVLQRVEVLDLCTQLYLKIGYIKLGDGTDAALAGLERLPKRRHIVADRSDGTHAGDYYTFHIFAPSFQYHDRTPVRC